METLRSWWADRQGFYVGGNMFVYFSLQQVRNKDFRGPDVFVALGVPFNPEDLAGFVLRDGVYECLESDAQSGFISQQLGLTLFRNVENRSVVGQIPKTARHGLLAGQCLLV